MRFLTNFKHGLSGFALPEMKSANDIPTQAIAAKETDTPCLSMGYILEYVCKRLAMFVHGSIRVLTHGLIYLIPEFYHALPQLFLATKEKLEI